MVTFEQSQPRSRRWNQVLTEHIGMRILCKLLGKNTGAVPPLGMHASSPPLHGTTIHNRGICGTVKSDPCLVTAPSPPKHTSPTHQRYRHIHCSNGHHSRTPESCHRAAHTIWSSNFADIRSTLPTFRAITTTLTTLESGLDRAHEYANLVQTPRQQHWGCSTTRHACR